MAATIIYGDAVNSAEHASGGGDQLLLTNGELTATTGWEIKPEGICRDEVCIMLPPDQASTLVRQEGGESSLDLAGFARYMNQPYAHDDALGVWYFGQPSPEVDRLAMAQAPDFTLPDYRGQPFTFSSLKGKKVFLVCWATWCGCRLDLPTWQAMREELKGQNFELVTVDCDAKGMEVAEQYITAASPTHPTLIDQQFVVPELYNTRNVPAAFWIDEEGRIVRANDPIYATRRNRETGETTTNTRYLDALRDWVAKGAASIYVESEDVAKQKAGRPDEANTQAMAHFRLATYLNLHGHEAEAIEQFKHAHELKPDNWNYKRQAYNLGDSQRDYGTTMQEQAATIPFYPPLELPDPQ